MTKTERLKHEAENTIYTSKDGKQFKVVEYRGCHDCTIEFIDSGFRKDTSMYYINNSKVNSPFLNNKIVAFEDPEKEYLGCKYNINGDIFEVIEYVNAHTVKFKVLDEFGYEGWTTIHALKDGGIRNPYHRGRSGCYFGEPIDYDKYDPSYNKWVLQKWHGLTDRATGQANLYNMQENSRVNKNSRMCIQWQNFANFYQWFNFVYAQLDHNSSIQYDVDKDLMFAFYGHYIIPYRLYCPITCELLPHDLNVLIYDPSYIRNEIIRKKIILLGREYYSKNQISERAYKAIEIIYNGNKDFNIIIDIPNSGFDIFAPRVDNFPQFYEDKLI